METSSCFALVAAAVLLAGCRADGPRMDAANQSKVAVNVPANAIHDDPPESMPRNAQASLQPFAQRIGVSCDEADGHMACIGGRPEIGDDYDVDLHPGCGSNALIGEVSASQGADLRDRIAPLDQRTIARVDKGQLLCIQAIGWAGKHASYYFVTVIPGKRTDMCANGAACNGHGESNVHWVSQKPAGHCAASDDQREMSACASGWIRGEKLVRIGTAK